MPSFLYRLLFALTRRYVVETRPPPATALDSPQPVASAKSLRTHRTPTRPAADQLPPLR